MSFRSVSYRLPKRRWLTMQPRRKSFLSTGTTSIVLIFVLLCLLTFAVLSVVSARADYKLSEKNTTRTTEYYEAENTANDILLKISTVLSRHAGSSAYLDNVRTDLDGTDGICSHPQASFSTMSPSMRTSVCLSHFCLQMQLRTHHRIPQVCIRLKHGR